MKTEFLKELGVAEDVISKIMAENGKDIEREKAKATTAEGKATELSEQLKTATETLKSFEGVDVKELQGKITQLTTDLGNKDAEYQSKLAKMERQGQTKEFLSGKKFINDATKEYYFGKLESMLDGEDSKGKSREELLDSMTKDEKGEYKPNIFVSEQTGATGIEHGSSNSLSGVEAAFQSLNPNIKLE